MFKLRLNPIFLLLVPVAVACNPKPVRPITYTEAQSKELAQCEYLYGQCMGKPGPYPANAHELNSMDWNGQSASVCNKRLKQCYDGVVTRPAP